VVQCRQIYVLCHATLLSGREDFVARAGEGIAFLSDRFWDARNGGWYFSVQPDGTPHDRTKDCYGHAFVLFAMAYAHRALGGSEPLELAERTLEVLERRFAEPNFGGFVEAARDDWEVLVRTRRQNPHMHLLEALLALQRATGEARYTEHAHRIFQLFERHFFDGESGTLGEFFHDDWTPHAETGHLVEPGHHFEWTWLLLWYAESCARPEARRAADRLFEWAVRHGVDLERGGVFDELDRTGKPRRDTKRLWPLTEGIKASALRYERQRKPEELERLRSWLDHLFQERLFPDGRWREQLDRGGNDVVDYMPCSTPYHLFLSLSEALRALED
jgi:mannose-6-phosphate isomerase